MFEALGQHAQSQGFGFAHGLIGRGAIGKNSGQLRDLG
jgi:hypothetical protein